MLSDICALAEDPAEVRNSQRDETDRATDRYSAGHKEHDGKKQKCLVHIAELDFALHMACELSRCPDSGCQTDSKQYKREYYISCSDAFQIEVGGSPDVVLLEKVGIGRIGHYDGSKRTDKCSEEDSKGNEMLCADSQCDKEAYCGTYQCTDEASDGKRAPA